ncbi:hypothetical protein [Candidatus Accumulibacter vicinus]|uniref:Uncharacterized protein n=1 Tax=Candidatus Accumulibacter vicinus TaxID=2954382 RepID=A0A084Y4J3_9PROT|nr:hypothetical protein [Candidatus Accumulibacter vicinus]KFB69637.1 MAG: hypothetical protein CAPSK01_000696 [Candidatus Accumulibacter vicinus]
MLTHPPYPFAWLCVAVLLCVGPALAQEEPTEPDPDIAAKIDPSPRNPDMTTVKIIAQSRAQNAHQQSAAPASVTSASSLRDQDLRMLAARGLAPTVNVCSNVVQTGRGAAQAPVIQNSRTDINCVVAGVVVGR